MNQCDIILFNIVQGILTILRTLQITHNKLSIIDDIAQLVYNYLCDSNFVEISKNEPG